jgi:hypothetical protein
MERCYPLGLFSAAMLATALVSIVLWFSLASIIHTPTAREATLALGIRLPLGLQLVKPEPVENAMFALTPFQRTVAR